MHLDSRGAPLFLCSVLLERGALYLGKHKSEEGLARREENIEMDSATIAPGFF
jgi:hypothetical protein